jgi:hypothetical protein
VPQIVLTRNGNDIAPGRQNAYPRFLFAPPGLGDLLFSATGTNPSNNSNIGEELWIEMGPPVITGVRPLTQRTYRMREIVYFVVEFKRPTLVIGSPKLKIQLQDTDNSPSLQPKQVFAIYISGSGSNNLVFRYVVKRGERDKDGIDLVPPLDLSEGAITNLVGDPGDGQFSSQPFPTVLVDGFSPWVMQVHGPRVGTYGPGSTLTFQLITSEAVTVTPGGPTNQVLPYLNLRIGNNTRRANFVGASGNVLTFRYKVQAGDYAPNGIYLDSSQPFNPGTYSFTAPSIRPPEASAPSGPRNLDANFQVPVFAGVYVDTRGPRIADIILPGLRNYVTGEVLEFRFRFDEKVYLRGSSSAQPSLRLQIGSAIRQAALVAGLGTNTLTFRYTVQSSDQDLDGIRLLDIALPSGTRLTDLVGNVAPLTFTPPDTRLIRINAPTVRL